MQRSITGIVIFPLDCSCPVLGMRCYRKENTSLEIKPVGCQYYNVYIIKCADDSTELYQR